MLGRSSCCTLVAALLSFASASAQIPPAATSDLGITVSRLSPRVAVVHTAPWTWNNSYVAIATRKGIVVIDSGFSKTIAQAVRKAIETEFKRSDFAYLILTHEHSDHIFGNSAYADVPIVGSDLMRGAILKMKADPAIVADRFAIPGQTLGKMREELLKDPKAADKTQVAQAETFWKIVQADYASGVEYLPPTITFDRRLALNLGDVTVHLFSYGHWHSIADTIVSIPEENIVRLGAILYGDHLPVVKNPYGPAETMTPAMVDNWVAILKEVVAQSDDKTQFISCHGWGVMSKAQVAPQVAYLEKLWNQVRSAKTAGKTLQETKASLPRAQAFPEVASLGDSGLQVSNIHEHNIEALWTAAP